MVKCEVFHIVDRQCLWFFCSYNVRLSLWYNEVQREFVLQEKVTNLLHNFKNLCYDF
jgi:hypothetical protein